ncbi:MAG: S-layer family protein [Methylobacillus glycogenes]|nr:S-layer family protein [Methylobacillus glycogenes]
MGGTDHIPIVQTEPNATEGVRPPGQPDAALPIHTGIQTVVPGIFKLPSNSLFKTSPDNGSHYLVETNPRFTNYRNWMSSDYMFKQMSFDPAMTQKRLGDGFYEQKIIREQVAQLTGRRFLQGYASDEAQFEALMNNGLSHYQSLQLIPGVALTALQMARLTSDIVWLVQEDIVMPDGSTVKALVPRLYVMPQAQDLEPGLGMLAGNTVNIRTSADISNSGTIAGRQLVNLSADNIRNLGGNIQAKQVSMNALTDIINQGGSVKAKDAMRLHAGRDITLESTTNSSQHQQGASSFSRTNLNRVASLYVDGANASLDISAGRNLTLNASQIINTGEHGKTSLSAGNDITLGTVTIAERNNGVINAKNYNKDASSRELGSSVQAQGDIRFSAGGDINMVAVDINSQAGDLSLNAGEDINISEGRSTREVSSSRSTKSKGFLSSKRSLNQFNYADDTAIASTLSAENISLQAGLAQPGNLSVTGSNIVATQDNSLQASGNITINSAANTSSETHIKKEKRSGFGASGSSIGYSNSKLSQNPTTTTVSQLGSSIGSIAGDVNIKAGQTYQQSGSDILTPQGDINISAQRVDITAANNLSTSSTETKYKQSGVSLSLSNPVINAIQTTDQMQQAARNTDEPWHRDQPSLQAVRIVVGSPNI